MFSIMTSTKSIRLQCIQWGHLRTVLKYSVFNVELYEKINHCSVSNDELFEKNNIAVFAMMNSAKRLTLQCFQWWTLRKDLKYSVFNGKLFEKINITVFSMLNSSNRFTLQCFQWFNSSKMLTLQCFQWWTPRNY